ENRQAFSLTILTCGLTFLLSLASQPVMSPSSICIAFATANQEHCLGIAISPAEIVSRDRERNICSLAMMKRKPYRSRPRSPAPKQPVGETVYMSLHGVQKMEHTAMICPTEQARPLCRRLRQTRYR